MRPIPVAFHIWFLEVHTYGIGLALTFWFGLRYTERRLRNAGYPWQWVTGMFVWVIVAAIVGARALHVLSNLSYYTSHPAQVVAIWQGGLSSFGGLLFAVPVAVISARRRCPQLPTMRFADLMAPVLMACWGIGRLLGPQLMVAGGGHPTHQWFGMYYAGQRGPRLPVPIFQALEDFSVYLILIAIERRLDRWPDGTHRTGYPSGIVLGTAMVLWGIERSLDEHLWLGEDGRIGSDLVQLAGVILVVGGTIVLLRTRGRWKQWLPTHSAADAAATGAAAEQPA
jgi:phosphatidylglycerol:prolipoprotein diacylglycerol transferase